MKTTLTLYSDFILISHKIGVPLPTDETAYPYSGHFKIGSVVTLVHQVTLYVLYPLEYNCFQKELLRTLK